MMAGVPVVRPLSIDDRLPGQLQTRLKGLGPHWDDAAAALPFASETDEDGVLDALKREALATDVRQQTMAFSAEETAADDWVNSSVRNWYTDTSPIQSLLEELSGATEVLDPRIGQFRLSDAAGTQSQRTSDPGAVSPVDLAAYFQTNGTEDGIIESHDMVDATIGQFVDVLLGSTFQETKQLSTVTQIDSSVLNFDALDGDVSEQSADDLRSRIVTEIESANDPYQFLTDLLTVPSSDSPTTKKLERFALNQEQYGDSGAMRSLLRLLLQHSTLQEYVTARRRLGLAYDDVPDAWPDPAYYTESDVGPLETLHTEAPAALGAHPNVRSLQSLDRRNYSYDYVNALEDAALNYTSSTSIDPRISEFTDSVRYLGGVEPADLGPLLRETLDLANHRLDAWWTSLATKDLFELREAQGTYDPEGEFDHETWTGGGSDVPRATVEPGLLSHLGSETLETGTGGTPGSETDTTPSTDQPQTTIPDPTGTGDQSTNGAPETGAVGSSTDTANPFDPAQFAGMEIRTGDAGTSDDPSQPDGGFEPTGGAEPGASGSETGSTSGASGEESEAGQSVDLSTVQEAGGIATRTELQDPSSLDERTQTEPGLYVGGYGFVEQLSADVEGRDEPEYVHAPSEQHATTAAVLRSGFQAHEDDEGENVLATDLSAERVRAGLRLIRGVRRGQSLGELLGYRFERRLREKTVRNEADLMQYADEFRAAFPAKLDTLERPDETSATEKQAGNEELAKRDVVDGRKLVENWEAYPFGHGEDLPAVTSDSESEYAELAEVVTALRTDIDAAGDLLTAESVHQLGQGNYERAGGSIAALARGEPLPDPQIAAMPRSETGLTHRQCLLFGTHTADSTATPRTKAEPVLADWVAGLLPPAGSVEALATYRWSESPPDSDSEPTEQSHETPITLADLELGSLDILMLFGGDSKPARSELEQRFVYQLIRDRPASPAVPADAELELEFERTQTADATAMADLLELCRSIRELIQTARPANAEDLAHPSDQQGEGYDAATADTLAERANTAQDELLAVTRAIDERLSVLDSDHQQGDGLAELAATDVVTADGGSSAGPGDGSWGNLGGGVTLPDPRSPVTDVALTVPTPTLTEQVAEIASATDEVIETVPLSDAESAANASTASALRSELTSLLDTLPAGLANPDAVTADTTVESGSQETIEGRLGQPIDVPEVPDQNAQGDSNSGEDSGGGDSGGAGGAGGHGFASGATTYVPLETESFASTPEPTKQTTDTVETVDMAATDEVEYTGTAWYADTIDPVVSVSEDPSAVDGTDGTDSSTDDSDSDTEPDVDWSSANATIRVWGTDALSYFERETTTTPQADGSFTVALDFSSVEPGTPFRVVAIVDGTIVYSASGRVVADSVSTTAQTTLETDCPTLRQLLWLSARRDDFDTASGAAGALSSALGFAEWEEIEAERDAADPTTSPVTTDDVDAVEDLLDLKSLDPERLEAAVDAAAGPVRRLGLDRIVDVTGDGAPGDVWYGPTTALSDVRARLTRTLDNPALYNDGVAPWMLSYHHDAAAVLEGMSSGATVAAYLDAFCAQPTWTIRYLDQKLSDADAVVRDLTAWLYSPADLDSVSDLETGLQELRSVVSDLPALAVLFEGLPSGDDETVLEAFERHLQRLASALGASVPSMTSAAMANTMFDSNLDTALGDVATAAQTESTLLSPVADSGVERSVRRIVLERLREPMAVAASYGVFGGTPRSPDGGSEADERDLLEQARALLERLRARLSDTAPMDPRLDSTLATQPAPQRVELQTDRLETLFGDGFTVLPPFTPANGEELAATFTDDQLVPDENSMAAETWLQRAASFRDNVAAFRESRSYAEALSSTLTPSLTVGQVPYEPGDSWVGVEDVEPAPGKLSLVAQFESGATPASVTGQLTGLFVDEWTEGVPEDSETTGLALNYDDPGNRAPQSILVATPPADGEWSLDDLAATVAETGEYAKRRAVDQGDLPEVSRLFPGLYFAQQTDQTPRTPAVRFGMLDWYDREPVMELVNPELQLLNFDGGESK